MFQFPSLAYITYVFCNIYPDITLDWLSNSEIPGSKTVTVLPGLIAGSHVLHRLLVPRHPPYALCNFFQNPLLIQVVSPDKSGDRCINILVFLLFMEISKYERTIKTCGVTGNRTPNPQLAKLVLYQLSYNPLFSIINLQ